MRLEFDPSANSDVAVRDEAASGQDLQVLLKKGISAAQAGDRILARQLLDEVVKSDPKCSDAWMWLASIAEYPEELLACLDNVLDVEPDNSRAAEWHAATLTLLAKTFVGRAAVAREAGDDDAARRLLDQAIGYDNDCEAAWLHKAELTGDEDKKVGLFNRVLAINASNENAIAAIDTIMKARVSSRLADAKAAAARGDNPEALAVLAEVLDADDSNADAWMLRSHLASEMSDKLHALEKVIEIQPDNAAARASYDFLASTIAVAEEPRPEVQPEPEPVEYSAFEESVEIDDEAYAEEAEDTASFDPFQTITHIPVPEMVEIEESDPHESMAEQPIDNYEEMHSDAVEVTAAEYNNGEAHEEEYQPRSAEEMFGPEEDGDIDADRVTEESVHITNEPVADPVAVADVFEQAQTAFADDEIEETVQHAAADPNSVPCPYCWEGNEPQAFECQTCHASLTLSDVESLISNPRADREAIQNAVTQMEGEWNLREFTSEELISLGIGHFNLGNYGPGIKYLQEASLQRPNDVILSSTINTLVIRLDEVRRQNEINDGRPKGRTILVVDDSATVRKLISGKLEKSGHTVVCAEDGVEGLARIRESLPDLVLLDITMPRMDGYEVCRRIRSNVDSKDIPVVMISGKDGFFDKVRGRMAGTTAYITKPFGPETLMKALETYLSGEPMPVVMPETEPEPVAV